MKNLSLRIRFRFATILGVSLATTFAGSAFAIPRDQGGPPSGPIPPTFFGIHRHVHGKKVEPWPTVPFGTFRLWDSNTSWAQLNPSKGKYDWEQLDKWFSDLKEHHVEDILYTFGRVPDFASSKPNDGECGYSPGSCDPPSDLKPDGSGTDQYWKDFVTAIVTHSKESHTNHIKYWEVWNEPFHDKVWTGTQAQLVRMAKDAQTIIHNLDPDALVLTPSPLLKRDKVLRWWDDYLAAGGGEYADVIAFHGYVITGKQGEVPDPVNFVNFLADFRKNLAAKGLGSKPLWDTEAGWGNAEKLGFADENIESAFLAQFYILHWSSGVQRLYWYSYNNPELGTLWRADPSDSSRPGSLTKGGNTYRELYNWLVGSTMTQACSADGSTWTCNLTRPDGHPAMIVWNVGGEKNLNLKGSFKKMRDLDGGSSAVAGPVKVGPRPVLLESQ